MKKDSLAIDGKLYLSSKRAAEIAGYSKDYVGQLCRSGKLLCRRIDRLWWVDEESIRKHSAEALKANQTSFRPADPVEGSAPEKAAAWRYPFSQEASYDDVPDPISESSVPPRPLFRRTVLIFAVIVAVFAVGVAALSLKNIDASPGENSADAYTVWNSIYEDLVAFIWPSSPAETPEETSLPHAGLVVVPENGSTTSFDDAKLAETISNSFSDDVTVAPGQNGTTGVITPEFRTVKGHDFLYVLVPVKTSSSTASPASNSAQ